MIKKILLFTNILMLLGCNGAEFKNCKIVYTYENPSLGPKYGYRKFLLEIENKDIVKVVDLESKDESTPGLSIFKKILNGNIKDLNITYDSNKNIKTIKPIINEKVVGGSFIIKVIKNSCNIAK